MRESYELSLARDPIARRLAAPLLTRRRLRCGPGQGAEGHVLLTSSSHVRGKGSGVVVDQRVFTVVTLRHEKLTQIDDFSERSQALEAAGLRE